MIIIIYQKIEKGQDEICICVNYFDQCYCVVFLMINGEKICDDIFVQL